MESFQSLSSYMLKFKNIKLDTPTDNAAINPINKGFKPNQVTAYTHKKYWFKF